jgi:hypothetical protein
MTEFVREKQNLMMQALKSSSVVKGITVESYFEGMGLHVNEFKIELYQNLAKGITNAERLEYLNLVEFDFKEVYWLFHTPFSTIIFPEIVIENNDKKNNYCSMMFALTK